MHTFKKVASIAALIFMTATSCFAAEGTVIADALNIRSAPGTDSTVISKAYKGEILDITALENSFYRISYDGVTAYASSDYVAVNIKTYGTVADGPLNVRSAASADAEIVDALCYGEQLSITGVSGEWYEILYYGQLRYVHSSYVTVRDLSMLTSRSSSDVSRDAARLVAYSQAFLGVPYLSGGSSPSGFDCSGFTSYVYAQFGFELPRTSASQAAVGTPVSRDELLPGDLVFFNTYGGISHVGIYIGDDQFIHSTVPGDVVKISDLNTDYYSSRYVTATRIIQ